MARSATIYFIRVLHVLIVAFVVLTPFLSKDPFLDAVHIASTLGLMFHWAMNSNMCALSALEGYLRNMPLEHSFIHRIVAPIYDLSKHQESRVIWITTLALCAASVRKLFRHKARYFQKQRKINSGPMLNI